MASQLSCRIKAQHPAGAFRSLRTRGPGRPLSGMAGHQSDLYQTSERRVGYYRLVGKHASPATQRTLPSTVPVCQLLPALYEAIVETTRREKVRYVYDPARSRCNVCSCQGFCLLRSSTNRLRWHKRSTPSASRTNWSSSNRPSFAVL
jgi:hypothetical protein